MTATVPRSPSAEDDPEELKRFREAWKAEVAGRKYRTVHLHHDAPDPAFVKAWAAQEKAERVQAEDNSSTSIENKAAPRVAPRVPVQPRKPVAVETTVELSPQLQRGVEVYRRAVAAEQCGDLDSALRLYRQAFRLDPQVDRAYHFTEQKAASQDPTETSNAQAEGASVTSTSGTGDAAPTPAEKAVVLPAQGTTITGVLADIVSEFPHDLAFEPEDERERAHIDVLPDELLVHVLMSLDPSAIERFAIVNRKARVVSLDSSIWRGFVRETYKPPQVPDEETIDDVADRFRFDYRRLYVEHPRLRLDGVYIAVCHYIRNGLSPNPWVNMSHLITYHRYLRFFPDGSVLSLLANEELEPQHVIPQFKHSLRMKGLSLGTWTLTGTTITIDALSPLRPDGDAEAEKYVFRMTLVLRSRPTRGRWNKLEWATYESVRVRDGEVTPFTLKHERPFWFSKVKSYAV